MSRLFVVLLCTLLHQSQGQSVIANSLDATYVANGVNQVLDAATAANIKKRCVGFRFAQTAPNPNPNPIQVTSALYRVAGLAAAVLTNGVVTTAAETALPTIRRSTAANVLIPDQTAFCTFTTITGSALTAPDVPLGQNVEVTPTAPCTLERDTNYWICLEAINGILTWVNTDDNTGGAATLADSMAATLGVTSTTDAVLDTFATQTGAAAAFGAAVAQTTVAGGRNGWSMVRLLGVFAFSPSPVTTPRPSPSPVTVTTTTPVANEGSDSALYGLFALIALPVLLAIAALAACWYYLTRRPAGLEIQEQVPRHYQQVPPPTPAPAVPYFPSVYAPGAYMPAPGMVLPPAYAF